MYSNDLKTGMNNIDARLHSSDWGIWGKEKTTYTAAQLNEKHARERDLLQKLLLKAPRRLQLALRYSYAVCDLDGYAMPVTEAEYSMLERMYLEAQEYGRKIESQGLQTLVGELYCIHKLALDIPGFRNGILVNETNDPLVWRRYFYLDFFKFSLINILMRRSVLDLQESDSEQLTADMVLAYFLGVGNLLEKASVLFSTKNYHTLLERIKDLCGQIELTTEFPDIQYQNYERSFVELADFVATCRVIPTSEEFALFSKKRYEPISVCEKYYERYFNRIPNCDASDAPFVQDTKRPLQMMVALYEHVIQLEQVEADRILSVLRTIREYVDIQYSKEISTDDWFRIEDFYGNTTDPFFQALLYEGKILNVLFQKEYPNLARDYRPVFTEWLPFVALNFRKSGKLFDFQTDTPKDMPRLVLTHHVHNADCEKLRDKMVLNRFLIWDSEQVCFMVSSSSSNLEVVVKERQNCLDLGFVHYRIHARQHLKAGNQNRAIPNALDGFGREYYFTLDDDYFSLPDFALFCHSKFVDQDCDFIQAPLAFKGAYERVTKGEKIDAESMLFFESTYGRNYPRIYLMPRGTGTIFNFFDGKNSLSDTGGFLLDYSCEDFGQGYLALIQRHSSLMGERQSVQSEGVIADRVFVIGEGVDLNGKLKQLERWNHGTSKVFFHLLVPVFFKSLMSKKNRQLLANFQFLLTFSLSAVGMTFRFMLFSFFCFPFLFSFFLLFGVQMPQIENLNFLVFILFVNYWALFSMYFYVYKKKSLSLALRMVLIEPITTMTAIVGYLKGFFGNTPKMWSANKSRKQSRHLYKGVYLLALINIVPLAMFPYYSFWLYFWPLFNVALIVWGLFMMHQTYVPKDQSAPRAGLIGLNVWGLSFIICTLFNVWFFVEEFSISSSRIKVVILCVMAFNFFMGTRSTVINLFMARKQSSWLMKLKMNASNNN